MLRIPEDSARFKRAKRLKMIEEQFAAKTRVQSPADANVRRAWSLALLTAIATFNTIDRQVIGILGTPIKAEFHLNDGQLGFLGLIYGLLFALCATPLASLASRTSRKAVIVSSMAIFSFATAFSGVAANYLMLIVSRIGVGLGEAGTSAPSQSIIADSYPKEKRTLALTIFSIASKPGGFIAFLAGGWLAQWFGWRATFLILGIPGLAIAIAAYFVVREPAPGASDLAAPPTAGTTAPTLLNCLSYLRNAPSFWHILIGQGLWSLLTLGFVFWIPQYLHRIYGLSLGLTGTGMAIYTLGFGAIGVLAVGWVTQRLQLRDERWLLGVLVVSAVIATPCLWVLLITSHLGIAAIFALPPVLVYTANLGSSSAASQSVVPARMRTTTAGLTQGFNGLLGMGLGPYLPGVLSDLMKPHFGGLSIRYSLLVFSSLWLWASLHFLLANRTIVRDIARADAVNSRLHAP
jgi:predicted MFS family arabinose efflux permease